MSKHCIIADLHIVIDTDDRRLLDLLAPRYAPFCHRASDCAEVPVLFTLHEVAPFEPLTEVTWKYDFQSQDAWCVYEENANGVQITLQDMDSRETIAQMQCNTTYSDARCWLSGTDTQRLYCYNNFLMMLYAFASMSRQTLLFHASVIEREGKAYLFLAKSGTGKSTHSTLWLKHVPGCQLVNDDNPVVGVRDGQVYVYGSPWSGKTDCYRDLRFPVGGFARVNRAPECRIVRQAPVQSFAVLLPSCSSVRWNKEMYRLQGDTIGDVVARIPVYELYCTPYREAAVVSSKGMGAWDGTADEAGFAKNQKSLKPAGVTLQPDPTL
ncbi:MAG: hypothetical protein J6X31_00140 [Bacteroidales bacterium]|nr:hypothetical protein [Bacteroidales bacterium]